MEYAQTKVLSYAGSMNNLATVCGRKGQWVEAEELDMQVIKTLKKVQGPKHPDRLISMDNLASIYKKQGD